MVFCLEYIPVICDWKWNISTTSTTSEFVKAAVFHLKVNDQGNPQYKEMLSDSKVQQSWLQYSDDVTAPSYIYQCSGMLGLYHRLVIS